MKQAYKLFHDGILALARAEQQGLIIDTEYVEKTTKELDNRIETAEKEFYNTKFYRHWQHHSHGKININSPTQLANFLFKVKKIEPLKYTDKGTPSTDEEHLLLLNIPELNQLIEIRKLKKIRDTYLISYTREQVKGVLHPFFHLHTVTTYRSSSSSPNFQNVPKRDKEAMDLIRKAIYPRIGHQLMEVDFSGLEVSIAACYHKDPTMLDYLIQKKDFHKDIAIQIFKLDSFDKHKKEDKWLRYTAKNGFVFAQFYGDYYKNNAIGMCKHIELPQTRWKGTEGVLLSNGKTISSHLISKGISSFDKFVEHLKVIEDDFWNNRFKVYNRWKKTQWSKYQQTGYITSHTGFTFSTKMRKNETTNYPIQGAAFHCLLWSFIRLDEIMRQREMDSRIVGQIHDAIVIDVNPNELETVRKLVKKILTKDLQEEWKWINVPLSVEADLGGVDESWADLKEFKINEIVK